MDITFTKGLGKYDRMLVRHADGREEAIDCPKQGIIPHDMVHYAVEHGLGKRGFLTRVADGEEASFRMGSEVESDGVERLVEVFQGDAWSGGTGMPNEMIELYRVTCEARQCPMLPVSPGDIESIRSTIRELDARWQALAVGDSMRLRL